MSLSKTKNKDVCPVHSLSKVNSNKTFCTPMQQRPNILSRTFTIFTATKSPIFLDSFDYPYSGDVLVL